MKTLKTKLIIGALLFGSIAAFASQKQFTNPAYYHNGSEWVEWDPNMTYGGDPGNFRCQGPIGLCTSENEDGSNPVFGKLEQVIAE